MLGKIIKHEFKATWKFFAIAASVFTLMMILLRFTVGTFAAQNSQLSFLSTVLFIIMILVSFAVIAVFTISPTIVNIVRFYRTTVTSRGYLTHMLPVSTDKLIIGKLIVASLWQILTVLYAVAAFVILILSLGMLDPYLLGTTLTNAIGTILKADSQAFATIILILISTLISAVSSILKYYASMSIGQCFNRNKVLISIGIYVAISIIYSIITSAIGATNTLTFPLTSFSPQLGELIIALLKSFFVPALKILIFDIAFAAVYYILTRHFLKNKLNLS